MEKVRATIGVQVKLQVNLACIYIVITHIFKIFFVYFWLVFLLASFYFVSVEQTQGR